MKEISDLLKVSNASFYSHIFENQSTGLARSIYYCIWIEFEEFEIEDFELRCNIQGDWNYIQTRNWKDIDIILGNEIQEKSEWTFYTTSHDWIDRVKAHLRFDGSKFIIDLHLECKIKHVFDFDLMISKSISTDLEYTGLYLHPSNLNIDPDRRNEVREVVNQFVDIQSYEEPIIENGRYLYKPKRESVRGTVYEQVRK